MQGLIYGANGYTGELIAHHTVSIGMKPILAGRREAKIKPLAEELGLEYRIASLDDTEALHMILDDIHTVLHCAGPYSATATPMLIACEKTKTNYLDITGEVDVFEHIYAHADRWEKADIVVMPGVGMDVTPTDCMAAMLKRNMPDATHLTLALKMDSGKPGPGSAITFLEGPAIGGRIRRDGKLRTIKSTSLVKEFSFSDGSAQCTVIPWGDISTAFYSTGIPNITCYIGASKKDARSMRWMERLKFLLGPKWVQDLLKTYIEKYVKGPNKEERDADHTYVYGEVSNDKGETIRRVMDAPGAYMLTIFTATESFKRVLNNEVTSGAHTPSTAFGADFVCTIEGVSSNPRDPRN